VDVNVAGTARRDFVGGPKSALASELVILVAACCWSVTFLRNYSASSSAYVAVFCASEGNSGSLVVALQKPFSRYVVVLSAKTRLWQ